MGTVREDWGGVPQGWPQDRRDELADLIKMMHKLEGLNHGSDFIGKVQDCMETARRLNETDLDAPRSSFMSYLHAQALGRPEDVLQPDEDS